MFQDQTQGMIIKHIKAIAVCIRAGFAGPAMIFVYVGIDAFGALGRPVNQKRRVKEDFIAWADRYMVGPKKLRVTAAELYNARCGVLHTLGAESSQNAGGKGRLIFYAWGNRDPRPVNEVLRSVEHLRPSLSAVMVKIGDIADAFVEGVGMFAKDVGENPILQAEVALRAGKLFGEFGRFPGVP